VNKPSEEQQAIIIHTLAPLSVTACAGSGKTFTAVRRVNTLRDLLEAGRGRVALLSFSNVAVDVFGRSYLEDLKDIRRTGRSRVCIETFDGFITTNVLRPHASRKMESDCVPFLLTGTEAFLNNPLYQFKPNGQRYPADIDTVEVEYKNGQFKVSCRVYSQRLEVSNGIQPVRRLGKLGAYTHALGRYWAYETLKHEPKILAALAHRYPQIVVDEAQDIGSMQVALLELLASAGSEITLIGDPNQAIFEFCGADGSYLRAYPTRTGVVPKDLTINYRSVPKILNAANSLAHRSDTAHRREPATDNGAFFLPFGNGEEGKLIAAFEAAVRAAGLNLNQSAVVCRATKKKQALRNLGQEYGQGTTKLFASATMARDLARDYNEAFRLTVYAIVGLLKSPPRHVCAGILDPSRFPDLRNARKIVWEFTRNPEQGLPSGSLHMQLEWHPKLLVNVKALLERLEQDHQLASQDNLNMRLKKTGLPAKVLVDANTERAVIDAALRVETIHGVKGESLDAVLYLADKEHVKALVNGTGTELGRIGYVALTRARDLFWLGTLKADADTYRTALTGHTFVERQYDAQLDLPLASNL
jgi:superfamily I DNA/RNA helicase